MHGIGQNGSIQPALNEMLNFLTQIIVVLFRAVRLNHMPVRSHRAAITLQLLMVAMAGHGLGVHFLWAFNAPMIVWVGCV